jgi:O-acetyl-ADP-ribose deacetylase
VIHTVGPVWQGGGRNEDALLESCYRSVMTIARQQALVTLAFPAISTGVYGFPLERATAIAIRTVHEEMKAGAVTAITFACFGAEALAAYRAELDRLYA